MSSCKCFAYFLQLACAFVASPINGSSYTNSTHIECSFNRTKHCLIVLIWIAQKFIVVDLYNERDFVSVFPAQNSQHAKGRSNAIATAFDGQFYNIFRIKINWIGSKRSACTVFNSLVNREDGTITCSCQPSMIHQLLHTSYYTIIAVALHKNIINVSG